VIEFRKECTMPKRKKKIRKERKKHALLGRSQEKIVIGDNSL
jgi:hypothetical protein